jgi:class 3 adenylate cyclase
MKQLLEFLRSYVQQNTFLSIGEERIQDWEKEYRRLGSIYAKWGAIFACLGAPTVMFSEWKFVHMPTAEYLALRIGTSVLILIALGLFERFKFRHEVLFIITAYLLSIEMAVWVDCDNSKLWMMSQLTLFIPAAFITLLKPYWYVINYTVQLVLWFALYSASCDRPAFDLVATSEFVFVFVAGITAYLVAAYRYYLIRRNYLYSLLLTDALNEAELRRQKSDELLYNILPVEVAEELKLTGQSEARQFDNITVIFTDFVNFAGISEQLSPTELVAEIDTCFRAFDAIIEKHGLEKIKTIGDAYMAVAGLPKAQSDHAVRVARAAVDILRFIETHRGKFNVRIGLHTGSVVAGIVGVKKYAYDIWGDTVNTAARMEQNSEANKINISGPTFELIRHEFKCVHRGKLPAKNKGTIDMYFIETY